MDKDTDPSKASLMLPDIVSVAFDGNGDGQAVASQDVASFDFPDTKRGFAWLHLRGGAPDTKTLLESCQLDCFVVDALMAQGARPRCTIHNQGILLNLRGINMNAGADPEDMVSLRLWIEARRVIGVWHRPLMAVRDQLAAIERNQSPVSQGDLVAKLALRLADRAEPSVMALNERIDEMEESLLNPDVEVSRSTLSDIRRNAIILRRHLLPQRDALFTLEIEDVDWLRNRDRSHLREAAERVNRLGEELDAIRDRAQIVHDQIMDRRAEQMNKQMLLLAVVASIFLPLGLITSLLGINVDGIPGAANPWAFGVVCVALGGLGVVLLLLFRRIGMFR